MKESAIIKSLDTALILALKIPFNEKEHFVILSDQHFGDGNIGSDDFLINKNIYISALNDYYENGFTLIEVGDVEELWECDFYKIFSNYSEIYEIEKRFYFSGRFYRIFGNHDIFWKNKKYLKKFLQVYIIYESILLGDKIFITHGHQGEFVSDRFWKISRWFVRNIWKNLQRVLHIPSNDVVKNYKVRDKKEQLFYNWAKNKKLLTIFGHTHRAFFESLSKIDRLRLKLSQKGISEDEKADIENRIQQSLENNRNGERELAFEKTDSILPCYFNDGCCCYKNGITAIEIENGFIRLVKWQNNGKTVFEETEILPLLEKISEL